MTRRLFVFLVLAGVGCGGQHRPGGPTPQTPNEALRLFMDAVKANDVRRMGDLWGSDRGAASTFMEPKTLDQKVRSIQKYLDHTGYRVIEGPLPTRAMNPTFTNVPSFDRMRDFTIELQRAGGCKTAFPITLVRTNSGGWLVYDVHLESAGTPGRDCQPGAGTRP